MISSLTPSTSASPKRTASEAELSIQSSKIVAVAQTSKIVAVAQTSKIVAVAQTSIFVLLPRDVVITHLVPFVKAYPQQIFPSLPGDPLSTMLDLRNISDAELDLKSFEKEAFDNKNPSTVHVYNHTSLDKLIHTLKSPYADSTNGEVKIYGDAVQVLDLSAFTYQIKSDKSKNPVDYLGKLITIVKSCRFAKKIILNSFNEEKVFKLNFETQIKFENPHLHTLKIIFMKDGKSDCNSGEEFVDLTSHQFFTPSIKNFEFQSVIKVSLVRWSLQDYFVRLLRSNRNIETLSSSTNIRDTEKISCKLILSGELELRSYFITKNKLNLFCIHTKLEAELKKKNLEGCSVGEDITHIFANLLCYKNNLSNIIPIFSLCPNLIELRKFNIAKWEEAVKAYNEETGNLISLSDFFPNLQTLDIWTETSNCEFSKINAPVKFISFRLDYRLNDHYGINCFSLREEIEPIIKMYEKFLDSLVYPQYLEVFESGYPISAEVQTRFTNCTFKDLIPSC